MYYLTQLQKMCPIRTFSCTCMMAVFAQLVTRIRNLRVLAQLNVPSTQSRVRSPSMPASRGVWLKTPAQASDSACFAHVGCIWAKKAKIFSLTLRFGKNWVTACMSACISSPHTAYSNAFREAGVSTLCRVCFLLVALMSNLWLKRSKTALEIR